MAAIEPQLAAAPSASARLYELHYARVFSFCLWRLRNREDAEDAAQTTFLDAHRALARGATPDSESAWLLGIAQNVCRTRWRTQRSRPVESALEPEALAQLAAPETDPELLARLQVALAKLPEQQRQALALREFGDLSYVEIAERLGTTEAAVASLVFRAREAVAKSFADEDRPRRLRAGANLGSVLGWLKSLLAGSALKAAATGLAIAAAGAAASVPVARHGQGAPAPSASGRGTAPRAATPSRAPYARRHVARRHPAPATAIRLSSRPRPAAQAATQTPQTPQTPVPSREAEAPPAPISPAPVSGPAQPPAPPPPAPTVPQVTIPAAAAPPVELPAVSTPVATIPSVTVPSVTLPAVTTPQLPISR
jgi:RNA polymerase sigma-70 factor (ECF subfamily)